MVTLIFIVNLLHCYCIVRKCGKIVQKIWNINATKYYVDKHHL